MANTPSNPDFPPQQFTARYERGFETDREFLEITAEEWDFVYQAVENFILCNPYLASWEIEDSGGCRFLITTEVPHISVPRRIVYFKPDEETRRVAFLCLQDVPEAPDYVDFES